MDASRSRGLTLVEVMVSMGLTSIVVLAGLGIATVYTAQVTDQLSTSDLNENLWGAAELVARELRRAGQGFAMCPEGRVQRFRSEGANGEVDQQGVALNYSDNPNYATPPLVIKDSWFCKPNAACRVAADFQAAASGDGPDLVHVFYGDAGKRQDQANDTIEHGLSLGGDTRLDGPQLRANDLAGYTNPTLVLPLVSVAMFHPKDFIVLGSTFTTTTRCTMFQISAVDTSTKQVTITLGGQNPIGGALTEFMGAGTIYEGAGVSPRPATITRIGQLRKVSFYVRDPKGKRPVLMIDRHDRDDNADGLIDTDPTTGDPLSNPKVVAEGVEDLQIAVACDRNADNNPLGEGVTVEERRADDFFPNVDGDTLGDACYDARGSSTVRPPIAAVRVTVVTRSKSDRYGTSPHARPALENRAAPGANASPAEGARGAPQGAGGYKRRVQTLVVSMRNLY